MRLIELQIERPTSDKNFPRSIMPQIRKGDIDDSPFNYNKENIDIKKLMPVQKQRVKGMHDKAKRGFADGTIRPIVIDKDNYIVNGHHRFDIALSMGTKKVDVLRVDSTIEELIDHFSGTSSDAATFEAYIKEKFSHAMENFADGKKKGKSRPGRVKKAGASCKGSVTSLRKKAKNSSGERSKMYHWCANMKGGKKKKTNEVFASPNQSFSNPNPIVPGTTADVVQQGVVPLKIGQQPTVIRNATKRFNQVLKKDNVLSPATKQALANVQRRVEQENNDDTPLWGKVFMLTTAVIFLTNKLSAAAQLAFADKDGDGDIDLDDMNDWNPDQINKGFDQLKQISNLMQSTQWSEMQQEDRNAFIQLSGELENKLNGMMQFHQASDDKQVDMDNFMDVQDTAMYHELANKIKNSEASKPFAGNEDKVAAAHDKYGPNIDNIKLSDDPLAVYKMYDKDGNYRVYLDSEGKPTVGVGHLIDKDSPGSVKNLQVGDTITPAEAHDLFKTDVDDAIKLTNNAIKSHPNLKHVDFSASTEVSYQMGNKVWNQFPQTMKLIDAGDFLEASKEVMKSKWAKQTPERAKAFSDALVMAFKMQPVP